MITTTAKFDLTNLLNGLHQLNLKTTEQIPFDELDRALSCFVLSLGQQLPFGIKTRPSDIPPNRRHGFGKLYLPFSIAADFPEVSPDQINILALATACLNLYVLLVDEVIDEPLRASAAVKLALQHVLLYFYRRSSELFSPASLFWDEVEQRLGLLSRAMLAGHQYHRGSVRPFSLDEFKRNALGTMAFAQINHVGLAILGGKAGYIPLLTKCWEAIALAVIVQDDVLDWREDYESRNFTYLLTQVLFSAPFRQDVEAGNLPEPAEVGAALFYSDIVDSLYLMAANELQIATKQAAEIDCPVLAKLIRQVRSGVDARVRDVANRRMAALMAMCHS
jgi:hypothetical protein